MVTATCCQTSKGSEKAVQKVTVWRNLTLSDLMLGLYKVSPSRNEIQKSDDCQLCLMEAGVVSVNTHTQSQIHYVPSLKWQHTLNVTVTVCYMQ